MMPSQSLKLLYSLGPAQVAGLMQSKLILRDCFGTRRLYAIRLWKVARARKSYLETPVDQDLALGLNAFGCFYLFRIISL